MDEAAIIQKLSRRVRTLNVMLGTFFILMLAMIAVLAILTVKVLGFIHDTTSKVDSIQNQANNSLNVKQQVCSDKTLSTYLSSNLCK